MHKILYILLIKYETYTNKFGIKIATGFYKSLILTID